MKKIKNSISSGLSQILSDVRLKSPKTDQISLDEIIKMRQDMDLDPPYQRKVVWKSDSQIALIKSINYNLPINTIHLVKKPTEDGGDSFIVLDGKQRLTSIFNFIDGFFTEGNLKFDFKIDFLIDDQELKLSYNDLKSHENNVGSKHHARAKKILREFRNYKITLTEWPDLTPAQQSAVFSAINFGMPLTREEKLLAEVYYSKDVAIFLMDTYFKSITNNSRSKNDQRSRDYIWCLRLFHLILNDSCDKIQVNKDHITASHVDFKSFLQKLHLKIENYIDNHNSSMDFAYNSNEEMSKMFEYFGWNSEIKEMSKYLTDFGEKILSNLIPGRKGFSDWHVLYFISFILEKHYAEKIKYGMFRENIVVFKNIFQEYHTWASDPLEDRNRRLHLKNYYDNHLSKLNIIYQKLVIESGIIDDNPKKRYISAEDKRKADQESTGICPICDVILHELDNKVYDHFIPNSISSDSKRIILMHEKCNRQKSDHTLETAKKTYEFIERFSS